MLLVLGEDSLLPLRLIGGRSPRSGLCVRRGHRDPLQFVLVKLTVELMDIAWLHSLVVESSLLNKALLTLCYVGSLTSRALGSS